MDITIENFYIPSHRIMFEAMIEMCEKKRRIDLRLFAIYLRETGKMEQAGGDRGIEAVVDATPTAANCQHYAEIVKKKFLARRIIDRCREASDACFHGEDAPDEIHAGLQADLSRMIVVTDDRPLHQVGIDLVEKWRNTKGEDTAIRWPVPTLHAEYGHLTDEFVIIMAQPSVGKTAFALQTALNLAKHAVPCAYLSLESSVEKAVMRLIAQHTPTNTLRLRNGQSQPREYDNAALAAASLKELPLRITNKSMTLEQVRAWAMLEKAKGAKCLFVDNLKHIRSSQIVKNRFDEFAKHSIGLKFIRDDVGIPLVVLHHTNSEGKAAWSSDIQRDADVMITLATDEGRSRENFECVDFQVVKNRDGKTGVKQLHFQKDIQTFTAMMGENEAKRYDNE
jgi:replicative DNA helicase